MKMVIQQFYLLLILSLFHTYLPAQITGLWEVEKVKVGEQEMTPVAKWFDLKEGNRLHSGNGGVRNTLGAWNYNSENSELLFQNEQGKADEMGAFQPVISPRPGAFDSRLVEPGPPPFLTEDGILFIYNSMNANIGGDPQLPPGTYAAAQVLLDPANPLQVLDRMDHYFIHPEKPYERSGQVGEVCFVEGLVFFKGEAFLYYGTADSKIAVAKWTPEGANP